MAILGLKERDVVEAFKLSGRIAEDVLLPILERRFAERIAELEKRFTEKIDRIVELEEEIKVLKGTVAMLAQARYNNKEFY